MCTANFLFQGHKGSAKIKFGNHLFRYCTQIWYSILKVLRRLNIAKANMEGKFLEKVRNEELWKPTP